MHTYTISWKNGMVLDFSVVETTITQGNHVKLKNEKCTLNKNSKIYWIRHYLAREKACISYIQQRLD